MLHIEVKERKEDKREESKKKGRRKGDRENFIKDQKQKISWHSPFKGTRNRIGTGNRRNG